jgi:hypothetical protein
MVRRFFFTAQPIAAINATDNKLFRDGPGMMGLSNKRIELVHWGEAISHNQENQDNNTI